ncbi:MAG: RluA family pseudouridine synthase [Deltaproteobacteria bacterium]|nr:RluA family pseudouridine synthase [Deltaproteobacteria bacterium]
MRISVTTPGARLDAVVAKACGVSLRHVRQWLEQGLVSVNQGGVAKGRRMVVGDVVEVNVPEAVQALVLEPHPEVVLDVIYEDEFLVAINKPGPLPSHPLRAGEGATAAGALVARYPECAAASIDPREGGLGHRLDQGTSGVLVAARSRSAWLALRQALSAIACEKAYVAEVAGIMPVSDVCSEAIGRGGPRGGKAVVGGGKDPLPARTEFERLQTRPSSSLVRARLSSGRVHQVRAHAAYLGFPVLGDAVYADERARRIAGELGVQALRLHAESVRLRHPMTGQPLKIVAPLPAWATSS